MMYWFLGSAVVFAIEMYTLWRHPELLSFVRRRWPFWLFMIVFLWPVSLAIAAGQKVYTWYLRSKGWYYRRKTARLEDELADTILENHGMKKELGKDVPRA